MICNYNNTWKYQKKFPKNFKKKIPVISGSNRNSCDCVGFKLNHPTSRQVTPCLVAAAGLNDLPTEPMSFLVWSYQENQPALLESLLEPLKTQAVGQLQPLFEWVFVAGFLARRSLGQKSKTTESCVFTSSTYHHWWHTLQTCHFQPYQLLRVIDGLPPGKKHLLSRTDGCQTLEQATSLEKTGNSPYYLGKW